MDSASQRVRWTRARRRREPRQPWAVVRRGLAGGTLAGTLLGAGLQGSVAVLGPPSPGLLASILLAGAVGALVAFPAALMAVIAYQALEVKNIAVAWVVGSLTAAATVLVTAALLDMTDSPLALVCTAVTFVVALVCAPAITTRRIAEPST